MISEGEYFFKSIFVCVRIVYSCLSLISLSRFWGVSHYYWVPCMCALFTFYLWHILQILSSPLSFVCCFLLVVFCILKMCFFFNWAKVIHLTFYCLWTVSSLPHTQAIKELTCFLWTLVGCYTFPPLSLWPILGLFLWLVWDKYVSVIFFKYQCNCMSAFYFKVLLLYVKILSLVIWDAAFMYICKISICTWIYFWTFLFHSQVQLSIYRPVPCC